jgi:type IV fimbrial biogenesis protein FimT
MLIRRQMQYGFTLIELFIGLAILGLLLALAFPDFSAWMTNMQIRSAAEKMQSALQAARNEAMRKNTTVRFSLVDSLTSSCALSSVGKMWIVSRTDPVGKCDVAPSDTTDPSTVQKGTIAEGSPRVTVTATDGSASARTFVAFNGIGRVVTSSNWIGQIDLDVVPANTYRKLRMQISAGGQTRMCDPQVSSSTDTRKC